MRHVVYHMVHARKAHFIPKQHRQKSQDIAHGVPPAIGRRDKHVEQQREYDELIGKNNSQQPHIRQRKCSALAPDPHGCPIHTHMKKSQPCCFHSKHNDVTENQQQHDQEQKLETQQQNTNCLVYKQTLNVMKHRLQHVEDGKGI